VMSCTEAKLNYISNRHFDLSKKAQSLQTTLIKSFK
jgi:hypothetical protein